MLLGYIETLTMVVVRNDGVIFCRTIESFVAGSGKVVSALQHLQTIRHGCRDILPAKPRQPVPTRPCPTRRILPNRNENLPTNGKNHGLLICYDTFPGPESVNRLGDMTTANWLCFIFAQKY